MNPTLVLFALAVLLLASCTTLENRRDMYHPQTANGPYTRMLKEGIPKCRTVAVPVTGGSSSDGKSVVR